MLAWIPFRLSHAGEDAAAVAIYQPDGWIRQGFSATESISWLSDFVEIYSAGSEKLHSHAVT